MTESLSAATHLHIHPGWDFKLKTERNLQLNLLPYFKNRTGFDLPGRKEKWVLRNVIEPGCWWGGIVEQKVVLHINNRINYC